MIGGMDMGKAIILLKRRFKDMPSAQTLKRAGFHLSSAVQIADPDDEQKKAPCRNEAAGGEKSSE